jgi:hypothetical protein
MIFLRRPSFFSADQVIFSADQDFFPQTKIFFRRPSLFSADQAFCPQTKLFLNRLSFSNILGRDKNAAHNIRFIFQQQYESEEGALYIILLTYPKLG